MMATRTKKKTLQECSNKFFFLHVHCRSLKQLGKLAEKLSGLSSKAKEVGGQFTMKYSSDR